MICIRKTLSRIRNPSLMEAVGPPSNNLHLCKMIPPKRLKSYNNIKLLKYSISYCALRLSKGVILRK